MSDYTTYSVDTSAEPLLPDERQTRAEMASFARKNPNARLNLLSALVEYAGLIEAIAMSLLADEVLGDTPMLPVGDFVTGHNGFLVPLMVLDALHGGLGGAAAGATAGFATKGAGTLMQRVAAASTAKRLNALQTKIAANSGLAPQQSSAGIPLLSRAFMATLAAQGQQDQQ